LGRKKQAPKRLHRVARCKPKPPDAQPGRAAPGTGAPARPAKKPNPSASGRRIHKTFNYIRANGDFSDPAFYRIISQTEHTKEAVESFALRDAYAENAKEQLKQEINNFPNQKLIRRKLRKWRAKARLAKDIKMEKRFNVTKMQWQPMPDES
jgi:hypothetical protein